MRRWPGTSLSVTCTAKSKTDPKGPHEMAIFDLTLRKTAFASLRSSELFRPHTGSDVETDLGGHLLVIPVTQISFNWHRLQDRLFRRKELAWVAGSHACGRNRSTLDLD